VTGTFAPKTRPLAQNRPVAPERRIRASLDSVADSLAHAADQADIKAWRWVTVSLCAALKGACVAALSGYPTAQPEDILAPDNTDRVASLATLLRRVGDARFLSDPERVSGHAGAVRDALALQDLRNRAIHISPDQGPVDFADAENLIPGAAALLHHLLLAHPAFDHAPHIQRLETCRAALSRLATDNR